MPGQETENQQYYYGTGKRKTAIARVKLYLGNQGRHLVNGKPIEETFPWELSRINIERPLQATGNQGRFVLAVQIHGGGCSAQADAIRHGVSKALVAYDENLKPILRQHGFLTRDARIKESKKYGLKRARRAPQYTKR